METKTDTLAKILDAIGDVEGAELNKVAEDLNKNTENKEAAKSIPKEGPHSSEKKLGLGVLSRNSHEEIIITPKSVGNKGLGGGGTENIDPKLPKAEPGVTFEKRASADVLEAISQASGVDLTKVASEEGEESLLLKVAQETLEEFNDLDKFAEAMAEATAEKFMQRINV